MKEKQAADMQEERENEHDGQRQVDVVAGRPFEKVNSKFHRSSIRSSAVASTTGKPVSSAAFSTALMFS